MPHEYTRQRQGRDFTMHETLMRALEQSRRDNENAKRGDEEKVSLLKRLEQYKKEAERNAVPIDGHEPPEKGRW
jgi:hypothetical protein